MRREEVRALGELAGAAAGGIAVQAKDLHEAIATRVFDALGPAGVPARAIHDGVAGSSVAARVRPASRSLRMRRRSTARSSAGSRSAH
jgi:hypothetical protein